MLRDTAGRWHRARRRQVRREDGEKFHVERTGPHCLADAPRRSMSREAGMSELAEVVRVAIHPAIGVARVGNSREDHAAAS
jgi:hypothetical protein